MPMPDTHVPLLVSREDAARLLAITPAWLRRLVLAGEIHAVMIGTRGVRFSISELERFIAQKTAPAATGAERRVS